MFLSLVGADNDAPLARVAEGLLRMARKRMPRSEDVLLAVDYWSNGLRDDKDKEQADRVYLVIRYVVDAVDKLPGAERWGGGETLVCTAIRSLIPLAPSGFSCVGDLYGRASQPPDSVRVMPYHTSLRVGQSSQD